MPNLKFFKIKEFGNLKTIKKYPLEKKFLAELIFLLN